MTDGKLINLLHMNIVVTAFECVTVQGHTARFMIGETWQQLL